MTTTHPTKEQVRAYMAQRAGHAEPPPSPQTIREQLGWHLLPNNQPSPTVEPCTRLPTET